MGKISDRYLGILIIGSFFLALVTCCFGICLVLWLRHKYNAHPGIWSRKLFRNRKTARKPDSKGNNSPEMKIYPTVSYSETGSEPTSPATPLSFWSPLTPSGGRNFQTFLDFTEVQGQREESTAGKERQPTPRFLKSSQVGPPHTLTLGATPRVTQQPPNSTKSRPSSLHLRSLSSSTISSTAASSESGTSASPADFDYFRTSLRGLESRSFSAEEKSSSALVSTYFDRANEHNYRFKIGIIKITVRYISSGRTLQINFLRGFRLPFLIHYTKYELYVKFSLMLGDSRIRCSKPLKFTSDESDEEVIATFQHELETDELSQSSIVITLCKTMQTLHQGLVIGSAFIGFRDFGLKDSEDFDSGVLELPMSDSNPNQMIFCGGFLEGLLNLSSVSFFLRLANIRLHDMNFSKIHFQDENNEILIYLKITIYEKGEPLYWRRTQPVKVSRLSQEVAMGKQVLLEIPLKKLNTLQLVLSVRLRTGKRGERCVLGNVYFSELWFRDNFQDNLSSTVNFHLPLQY